jgi:hypothetical protein
VSTSNDPGDQPPHDQRSEAQQWPQAGGQPPGVGYQQQPHGYQQPYGYQDPYGYQQPYGYQPYPGQAQYGGWPGYPQPMDVAPRRPGALITAGVLWLLMGAVMLLLGVVVIVGNQLPEVEQVYAENPGLTPALLTGIGVVMTALAVIVIGLGTAVFTGALWARIAIAVVGGLLAVFGLTTIVLPLVAVVATILQFLPAVNEYAKAKQRRRMA